MRDSWTMDTHHPLLPLENKIENIPLEVERQQGWGPNWGGKGDRQGGGVSSMRVTREPAGAGGRPLAFLLSPVVPLAALALLHPLELAGTEGEHECKSEEGQISRNHARRVRGGSGLLFQWKRAAGGGQAPCTELALLPLLINTPGVALATALPLPGAFILTLNLS